MEFENAFREDVADKDHFGFQPWYSSEKPANLHLQTVETISEVQNANFASNIRYHSSREASHSSTPVNRSPHPSHWNQGASAHSSSSLPLHQYPREFSNLELMQRTEELLRAKTSQESQTKAKLPETIIADLNLPQYFLVKYLGRTSCGKVWGSEAVRAPIDEMVHNARQLNSMSELPTLEASVSRHGLTLTHRQSPTRQKHRHASRSPERAHYGLIPSENISYVMHDIKYSKIASCIVLRQSKSSNEQKPRSKTNEMLTECYIFLFQSKDHAHRFALSLAQAFRIEKQHRSTKSNPTERKDQNPREAHRSKHRSDKQKPDIEYSRDSYV